MEENTPIEQPVIEETPVETPIEEPVIPEEPVVPEEPTDTPPELPIDPIEVVTLADEETLVGKAFTTVKDNITGYIVAVAFGASAMFAITPDNTLQESITVKDVPNVPKNQLVIREETPKLDVKEYTIEEKDKNIARLQAKLARLESARQSYITNQEPAWEKHVTYVDSLIQGTKDDIAAQNRDKDKAQPKLDALPDREINN